MPNPIINRRTGAAAANGLLKGLVSYWAYESLAGTDDQDGNTLTIAGGVIGSGFHNNDFSYGAAGSSIINPCPANMRLGTGASFTISTWQRVPLGGFGSTLDSIIGQYTGILATSAYVVVGNSATGQFRGVCYCTDATQQTVNFGLAVNNAYNHLVFGYDASTKTFFGQVNGGARQTVATSADLNSVATQYATGLITGLNQFQGAIDETAFWNRALSTMDAANLYNAGVGLFFPSFTN